MDCYTYGLQLGMCPDFYIYFSSILILSSLLHTFDICHNMLFITFACFVCICIIPLIKQGS